MNLRPFIALILLHLPALWGCGNGGQTATGPPYAHFIVGTWIEEQGNTALVFSPNDRYLEKRPGRLGNGTWRLEKKYVAHHH